MRPQSWFPSWIVIFAAAKWVISLKAKIQMTSKFNATYIGFSTLLFGEIKLVSMKEKCHFGDIFIAGCNRIRHFNVILMVCKTLWDKVAICN